MDSDGVISCSSTLHLAMKRTGHEIKLERQNVVRNDLQNNGRFCAVLKIGKK